ncbi:flagellar protein FlgN [Cohnella mopanensis]|uniref:flagellar protein FlgN n=1 Tax=Cohnella mopanensis TaxID=2911966 RepID=UPI001EF98F51|nr:flagellar protein FlgN [Cohnella mopanensis]
MAVDKVITVLEQLVEVHEQLIEIATEKRQGIMANDLDVLNRTIKSESKCIQRLSVLDRDRLAASAQLLNENGVKPQGGITLRQLYGVVFDPEQRSRLANLELQLKGHLNELRQRNELNQQLLRQSIDFVQFSIELIVPQADDSYIYKNPTGYSPDSSQAGIYNKRV